MFPASWAFPRVRGVPGGLGEGSGGLPGEFFWLLGVLFGASEVDFDRSFSSEWIFHFQERKVPKMFSKKRTSNVELSVSWQVLAWSCGEKFASAKNTSIFLTKTRLRNFGSRWPVNVSTLVQDDSNIGHERAFEI